MQRRYRWTRVHDYDSGIQWLDGGRKSGIRPLYHKNLYVSTRSGSIGIHFKSWGPDLIRYVPGNRAVISLPSSFNYVSTREVIKIYANLVDLYQKNNKLYLRQEGDPLSPSRQVKCPRCRGKGIHWYQCNGLKKSSIPQGRATNRYSKMGRDIVTFTGQKIWVWKCECLNDNPTLDPDNHRAKIKCDFCSGNGYRELGNKVMPYQWDGDPLVIDLTTGRIEKVVNAQGKLVDLVDSKGGA